MSRKVFSAILSLAIVAVGVITLNPYLVSFGVGQFIGTILPNTIGAVLSGILGGGIGLLGFFGAKQAGAGLPDLNINRQLVGRLTIRRDPNAPRDIIIGKAATAGLLVYRSLIESATEGDPEVVWLVVALAGHPVTSLETFYMNGEEVTIGAGGLVTTGTFAGILEVHFRTGSETTQAFPQIATSEGPASKWGSKSRMGRGICSAAIKVTADEAYNNQIDPLFEIKGSALYDPRLDDDVGGSGSHRWLTDSTLEWSANGALATLNFLRGFWIQDYLGNDVLIAGRGLKTDSTYIDFSNYIAEANTAEETFNVTGGGSIPKYESNGILIPDRPLKDILTLLDSSYSGVTVFSNKYRTYPAAWRPPTLTFDESDIVGAPTRIDIAKGPGEIVNIVRGTFADKENKYQMRPYPAQRDQNSIDRVGERMLEINYVFVTDHRQCQRNATISRRRINAPKKFTAVFNHRGARLAPGGDSVTINYSHYGFSGETMRVTEWELQAVEDKEGMPGLNCPISLAEDNSPMYAWDVSDERAMTDPSALPVIKAGPKIGQLPGSVLSGDVLQEQGGRVRMLGIGVSEGSGNDGATLMFAQNWEQPPLIVFEYTDLAPLAANEKYIVRAVGMSTAGFDLSARIVGTGSPSTQTDTTEQTPADTVDREIGKGVAAEADNATYQFRQSVIVEGRFVAGEWFEGWVRLGFYTFKNGVGWTLGATETFTSTGTYNKIITVAGLNSTSDAFGIKVESFDGADVNGIDDFIQVQYDHGSGATNVTATPSGYGPVRFTIIGGVEAGIIVPVPGVDIAMEAGALTMTGQAVQIGLAVNILMTTANIIATPLNWTFDFGVTVAQPSEAVMEITGQIFSFVYDVNVSVQQAGLTMTPQPGSFGITYLIEMIVANIVATPQAWTFVYDITVSVAQATLIATPQQATITITGDVNIAMNTATLTMTPQQATIGISISFISTSSGAFNFIKFTGTGAQLILNGVGFAPEVAFILPNTTQSMAAFDDNIGTGKYVQFDGGGRVTDASSIISFDSDGITIGSSAICNSSGVDYYIMVARDVTNVFRHFTYTGSGGNKTEAHGLGGVPDAYLCIPNSTNNGMMYHKDMQGGVSPEDYGKEIWRGQAPVNNANIWQDTPPSSTVISLGSNPEVNGSGDTVACYLWAADGSQCGIDGYTGNGSNIGPTISNGFAAEWCWITSAESNGVERWYLWPKLYSGSNPRSAAKMTDIAATFTLGLDIDFNATTMQLKDNNGQINANAINFIMLTFG